MLSEPTLINSNIVVESILGDFLKKIEEDLDADVLVFFGPIIHGTEDEIKALIESNKNNNQKLTVILETEGGYIETVEKIVNILRTHYKYVEFLVPSFAMSAGTVLVMSGDAIYMDYSSVLGPIDPQVLRRKSGEMVPALGYLEKYDELIEKSKKGTLTLAELNYLIEKFDPAELSKYEHARDLSIALLEEWLVKYKFKNWKTTQTKKDKVTLAIKRKRAKEIGKMLNKTDRWHSHGRGIPMAVLQSKEINLLIEDFGKNTKLGEHIKLYYRLLKDYMAKRGFLGIIHLMGQFKPIFLAR